MSRHTYPRETLNADYLRAGGGLVLTVLPLLLLDLHWLMAAIFAAAALLFAAFLARTIQRGISVVEVDDRGIAAHGPFGTAIPWDRLEALRLSYFSTRRDRTRGWMHLTLRGAGRRLQLESTLEGFDDVVDRAAEAAKARRLKLNDATLDNLTALGIVHPDQDRAEGDRADQGRAAAAADGRDRGWFDEPERLRPPSGKDPA